MLNLCTRIIHHHYINALSIFFLLQSSRDYEAINGNESHRWQHQLQAKWLWLLCAKCLANNPFYAQWNSPKFSLCLGFSLLQMMRAQPANVCHRSSKIMIMIGERTGQQQLSWRHYCFACALIRITCHILSHSKINDRGARECEHGWLENVHRNGQTETAKSCDIRYGL